MADIAIFRINYKSDFILTLQSDAGWATPFCIKFWTGAPAQAYFVGYDGTTYTHCAPVVSDPTKLAVQFDDHHLPIGDLKFQIGYHFTVADFPTAVEDEVINQAAVIIDQDDTPMKVMLDFQGETAPEIQFSLPAYANEAQRIANEQQRIADEQERIENEQQRIADEETRQAQEAQRIAQETARVNEFATLKAQSQAATSAANTSAAIANEKAQLAADKAALADAAATLANQKAQLAADKAALADAAATLANQKAQLAADKAALAQQKADYAQTQGNYAKTQGDYAKEQGDTALANHERAEADHAVAAVDHTTAQADHAQAAADHTTAQADHAQAATDHTAAAADHTTAQADHTQAATDHTTAAADHTTAQADHAQAVSDHAAVEPFADSLGAYDISAAHASGGVLATYADLTTALGTNGANIPEGIRKGGMSVKFVLSSDNTYLQYRLKTTYWSVIESNWVRILDQTDKDELVLAEKNAGIYNLTLSVPLPSGQFYQITDASAANFAPSAVPLDKRVDGMILKIQLYTISGDAPYNYQLYKFVGNSSSDVSWLNPARWVKITDQIDSDKIKKDTEKTIYNLTQKVPLSSGYYQITNASGANFAPNAIPEDVRVPGLILTIQISEFIWKVYQYNSYNTAGWLKPQRWNQINKSSEEFSNIYNTTYTNANFSHVLITGSFPNGHETGLYVRIKLPKATYFSVPKFSVLASEGYKNIVKPNGTGISLTDMRRIDKAYELIYDGTNWVLLNADDTYDIALSNMVSKSLINDIEIGYISDGGHDGDLNTRVRTKAGILYKSPLTLKVKSGYVLHWEADINISTGITTTASKGIEGTYEIPADNLLRRFVFRKQDNTAFTEVEDVAEIIGAQLGSSLSGDSDRLDLSNTETMLLVGTSHTEGNGSLKDKAMASYLSALSDWNVMNLGYSGSNYIKHLYNLLNDTVMTGSKWSEVVHGGVCLDFLNGNAENPFVQSPMDGKYTAENMRRLYSLIKTKGFDIICGSYWGDESLSIDDVQRSVAKELNLAFFDINNDCYRINQKNFLPYWFNGHFATRTVANQFFTLMQKYKIRRPMRAIKIYRNRVSGANINGLLYDNVFERLKNWRELSVGHRAIDNGRENYVDRLDLYRDNFSLSTVASEYTQLRNNVNISFSDKALIEFIFPTTADKIKNLRLYITSSASSPSVYVMKKKDISLALPVSPASAIFVIQSGISGISVGDVFTDTLNSGITFTVTSVDSELSRIMCAASGNFQTPGQTTDTLTRSSDSQTFTATSLTSGVPVGYLSDAFNPFGKWVSITATSGYYAISTPSDYMEYDKLSILVDNNETSFNISDVYATFEKSGEKPIELVMVERYPSVNGTAILEDKFNDTSGTIDDTHGSYIWDGNESYINVDNNIVTNNHIPAYYIDNKGVRKILHLKAGDKVSYNVNDFIAQLPANGVHDYRLTIVCRYFPASNLDISANTFTVTPNTFDFARLGIKYNIGDSSAVFTDERFVPASFVELSKDIHIDMKHTGNLLELVAVDDDVEIIYVKMEAID